LSLGVLLLFFWAWGEQAEGPGANENTAGELRMEIQALNLVNGLELSPRQMRLILESAEESERLRTALEGRWSRLDAEMEDVLEEIRDYLREGEKVPEDLARKHHGLSSELRKARLEWEERRRELAEKIEAGLEPHQVHQLREFVPCIIPPEGEVRIGQVRDGKGWIKSLERVRRIPPRVYRARKRTVVRRALKKLKLHAFPLIDLDEEKILSSIQMIFDEARSLTEIEFEIQKDNLAVELRSLAERPFASGGLRGKIERFLLSSPIIPVLQEKMARPVN